MKSARILAVIAAASVIGSMPARADDTGGMTTGSSIYTRMVEAMRSVLSAGPMTYDVTFEPHGLSINLIDRDRTTRPALVFSPRTTDNVMNVRENGDGIIDATDPESGKHFVGPSTFWAATWTEARAVATRAGEFASPIPTANAPGSPQPTDDGHPLPEVVTRHDVIGDVSTFSDRFYQIDLIADADTSLYHLALRARSDAVAHPLTDLYIDRETYMPVRVKARFRNEAYVSGYQGEMSLQFGSVEGRWVVLSGTVSAKVGTMKTELGDPIWATRADARDAVFDYIETWYNRKRLHSTLGHVSPETYESLLPIAA